MASSTSDMPRRQWRYGWPIGKSPVAVGGAAQCPALQAILRSAAGVAAASGRSEKHRSNP